MMRKLGKLTISLTLVALATPALMAEVWTIDTNHSAAHFAVKHLMVSTVRGQFSAVSGTVNWDPAAPENSSVTAEIDVKSVDTGNGKRDDHLRSPDFFDVEKFPTMKFESTRTEKSGDGLKLIGNLTMHGVTKEVTFDVDAPATPITTRRGMKTGTSAVAKISRKDFGMVWNRAIEAGGVTVGDEVRITIDIEMTSEGGPGAGGR